MLTMSILQTKNEELKQQNEKLKQQFQKFVKQENNNDNSSLEMLTLKNPIENEGKFSIFFDHLQKINQNLESEKEKLQQQIEEQSELLQQTQQLQEQLQQQFQQQLQEQQQSQQQTININNYLLNFDLENLSLEDIVLQSYITMHRKC